MSTADGAIIIQAAAHTALVVIGETAAVTQEESTGIEVTQEGNGIEVGLLGATIDTIVALTTHVAITRSLIIKRSKSS